ncbi:MAG: hypothetical protein V3W19_08545 [Desulfatiglandales bacterium]
MSEELTDEDIEDLRGMELWNVADGIDSLRAKLAKSAANEAALRKILIEIEKKETRCPFYCGAIRVLYGDLYKPKPVANGEEIKLMKHDKDCPLSILSRPSSEGAAAVRGLMEALERVKDQVSMHKVILIVAEALAAAKKAGL